MTTAQTAEFDIEVTNKPVGQNLPQRVGTILWAPMLIMAFMGFAIGFLIAIARAGLIAGGDDPTTVTALGHLGPAFMFIGFASVFAAISFAIARILGVLRVGGSEVQATTGRSVQTLKMPQTAKIFIGIMVMGMMIILLGVVANFAVGLAILGGDANALANSESSALWIEGIRRIGTAVYLVAIAFGLASIVQVLRFQALRIGELPREPVAPAYAPSR